MRFALARLISTVLSAAAQAAAAITLARRSSGMPQACATHRSPRDRPEFTAPS